MRNRKDPKLVFPDFGYPMWREIPYFDSLFTLQTLNKDLHNHHVSTSSLMRNPLIPLSSS